MVEYYLYFKSIIQELETKKDLFKKYSLTERNGYSDKTTTNYDLLIINFISLFAFNQQILIGLERKKNTFVVFTEIFY